jgi:hypothetical protein
MSAALAAEANFGCAFAALFFESCVEYCGIYVDHIPGLASGRREE